MTSDRPEKPEEPAAESESPEEGQSSDGQVEESQTPEEQSARPQTPAATQAETREIECPQCSTVSEVVRGQNTFCPTCDYPLFLVDDPGAAARPAVQSAEVGEEAPPGSRPGEEEDDIDAQATDIICRNCALRNPGNRTYCMRCGQELPPPEEWFNPDEPLQVTSESESPLWKSLVVPFIALIFIAGGVVLVLHFVFDVFWPYQTFETKTIVSGGTGISEISTIMVGQPPLPIISYYSDTDPGAAGKGGTQSSLNLVLCDNVECVKRARAFSVDPEGTPGQQGLAMVRLAGGPLIVYQRDETGSLIGVECGTIECDDRIGTRRFFTVESPSVDLKAQAAALTAAAADQSGGSLTEDAQEAVTAATAVVNAASAFVALRSTESDDLAAELEPVTGQLEAITEALGKLAMGQTEATLAEDMTTVAGLIRTAASDVVLGVGFEPSMAVTGGVPIAVYTGYDGSVHVAYLCESACQDKDGVVNTTLDAKADIGASMAMSIPRAGSPFIAYTSNLDETTRELVMVNCQDVTCGTTDSPAAMQILGKGDLGYEAAMVIDPNTLSPDIVFHRNVDRNPGGVAAPTTELVMLNCEDQNCVRTSHCPSDDPADPTCALNADAQFSDPAAMIGLSVIDSWPLQESVGHAKDLAMARGPQGAPVVAYRHEQANVLMVAVCVAPCGKNPEWVTAVVDDGGKDSLSVGYNTSITTAGNIAVIAHTDNEGTTLRITRVDVAKIESSCRTDPENLDKSLPDFCRPVQQ